MIRVCRCRHRTAPHQHWWGGTECAICGPDLCLRFRWRWWPWLRTLLALAAALVVVVVLTGCGPPAPPRPAAAPAPPPPHCTWYTPITDATPAGQTVAVTATGPACRTMALVEWIAVETGRPWAQTITAGGTVIAQLAKGGTVLRVWQSGWSAATQDTAGFLADDLELAGWTVLVPDGGGSATPPPPPSPIGSAGLATVPASASR